MQNITLTIVILCSVLQISSANTTPECLISNDYIEVKTLGSPDIFRDSKYDFESEALIFNTYKTISSIQIYTHEDFLEFQLPVMANQVILNKNIFGKGRYKLAFMIEGDNTTHFTSVLIKS